MSETREEAMDQICFNREAEVHRDMATSGDPEGIRQHMMDNFFPRIPEDQREDWWDSTKLGVDVASDEGADLGDPEVYLRAGTQAAEEMGLELFTPEERETVSSLARDRERRAEGIKDLMQLRGQAVE